MADSAPGACALGARSTNGNDHITNGVDHDIGLLELDVVPALLDEHELAIGNQIGQRGLQLPMQRVFRDQWPMLGQECGIAATSGQHDQRHRRQRGSFLGVSHLRPTGRLVDALEIAELRFHVL